MQLGLKKASLAVPGVMGRDTGRLRWKGAHVEAGVIVQVGGGVAL